MAWAGAESGMEMKCGSASTSSRKARNGIEIHDTFKGSYAATTCAPRYLWRPRCRRLTNTWCLVWATASILSANCSEEYMRHLNFLSRSSFEQGGDIPRKKIAFMFLTKREVFHQELWERFFIHYKDRYSLYVHHSQAEFSFPQGSFFARNAHISSRIRVVWGTTSMVQAELQLIRAGLNDVDNEQFVLLSESCIPLRPFKEVYAALIGNPHSVIDACSPAKPKGVYHPQGGWALDASPLDYLMEKLSTNHWRQSPQWFVLTRPHAMAVARDSKVISGFKKHCRKVAWGQKREEQCVADESYIPTLLSYLKLEDKTTCQRGPTVTSTISSSHDIPPYKKGSPATSFTAINVGPKLIFDLRGGSCPISCRKGGVCNLFARKFPKETESVVLTLADMLLSSERAMGVW
eukprot:CAMPEP_0114281388 /NCGR_PEP_ID=MMETSP0059-20121206/2967_1 /TAXON_ID=36894 /ORGANISM="Pyramimonas parkeae, Strain CCMP726" /LENGTH=405 /DNA_ID=CAMNT_0001401897 /DNA_START=24 /DNA_END=1238 /DNA_ORIENTATION=+